MTPQGYSFATLERTRIAQVNIGPMAIVLFVIFFFLVVILIFFAVVLDMLRFTAVAEGLEHGPHQGVISKSHGFHLAVLVAHGPCSLRTCQQAGIGMSIGRLKRRRGVGGASSKSNIGPPGPVGRRVSSRYHGRARGQGRHGLHRF